MAIIDPKRSPDGLDVYEMPIKSHTYVTTVDVARGVNNDYSAFIVFDATQAPIRLLQSIETMISNRLSFQIY